MESLYNTVLLVLNKLNTCGLNNTFDVDNGIYPFKDQIYEKDENKYYDDEKEKIFNEILEKNIYPGDSLPYPYKTIEELDKEMDEYWDEYWNKPVEKTSNNSIMYDMINELP